MHIPWCRKVCIYCDFHFSVSMKNREQLTGCMIRELDLQRDYLGNESIETIYFGGGTPSVLKPGELLQLIQCINSLYKVSDDPEITLEANPDDLAPEYLHDLLQIGINRLSIGVQSFFDDDLKWMNRRHNGKQAVLSIENSIKAGFENINIDLIYGLPGQTNRKWAENLAIGFDNQIKHLSAYNLTLEPKTVYAYRIRKGLMREPDEKAGIRHFRQVMNMAGKYGFIHYEISNFCLPGFMSRHNTSYWLQKPYLGIGPSANSYNGTSRQWNLRNNSLYIKSLTEGTIPCNFEVLRPYEKYNEYVMTGLRTMWGVDPKLIQKLFGLQYNLLFMNEAEKLFAEGKLEKHGRQIRLTGSGKLFADDIISKLFAID